MPKRRKYTRPGPKPSGKWDHNRNRIREDGGPTEEMKRHRISLVGEKGDMNKAENPLDALLERGWISERQHLAGRIYGGLRSARFGRRFDASILQWGNLVSTKVDQNEFAESRDTDETEEQRAERIDHSYSRADSKLRQCGTRAYGETQNVACFGRWPAVLVTLARGRIEAGARDLASLREGLTVLADHWKIKEDTAGRIAA